MSIDEWVIEAFIGDHINRTPIGSFNFDDGTSAVAVDPEKSAIQIVARTEKNLIIAVLRAVRQILRFSMARDGILFPHAAVIEVNGIGIAIIGPKRAGKSSLVVALLATFGGAFVSNGDSGLLVANSCFSAIGWPRSVRMRKSTLTALSQLHPCPSIELWHPLSEGQMFPPKTSDEGQPVYHLLPRELTALLRCELKASVRIHAIIIAQRDGGEPRLLRLLDDQERRKQFSIETYPFGPMPASRFASHLSFMLEGTDLPRASRDRETLLAQVPLFSLAHDPRTLAKTCALVINSVQNDCGR